MMYLFSFALQGFSFVIIILYITIYFILYITIYLFINLDLIHFLKIVSNAKFTACRANNLTDIDVRSNLNKF